jgi:hypothetical protein
MPDRLRRSVKGATTAMKLTLVCASVLAAALACSGAERTGPSSSTQQTGPTGVADGEGAGGREPYGTALGSYLGVTAFSNEGGTHSETYGAYGYQYECVEFVNRFYRQALSHSGNTCGDVNMRGCGNAKDYFGNAAALNLQAYSNGGTTSPQANDILAFSGGPPDSKGNTFGHVAIVRDVGPNTLTLIQQNYNSNATDVSMTVPMTVQGGTYTVLAVGQTYPLVAQGWLREKSVPPSTYNIAVAATPSNGGSVSGGGTYNANSSATVTATANSGFSFANWSENGNVVSTSTSYQFLATANRSLVANFVAITPTTYVVTVSASPSNGGSVSGGGTVNANSTVTVTASPNSGYSFSYWTENGSVISTNVTYSFTANTNRTLIANFLSQVSLSVFGGGSGNGTITSSPAGISCAITAGASTGGCTAFVPSGTTLTLTATAASGHTFAGWSGACSGVGSCQLTLFQTVSVTANFVAPAPQCALPAVTTAAANGSGQTTASVTGTIQTGGCATDVWAEVSYTTVWSTIAQSGITQLPASPSPTQSTLQISGLQSGSSYYARAVARNSQGTSYGGGVQFTTSSPVSTPPILFVNTTEVGVKINTGVSTTAQGTQPLTIGNTGGGSLGWTTSSSVNWLSISPSSGTLGAGGSQAVSVAWNLAGVQKGVTYTGVITITATGANGSPQTITVQITGF